MATKHTDLSSVVTWTKPEKELPPFGQDVVTIWKVVGSVNEVAVLPAHRVRGKDGSWESSYKDINSGLVYEASELLFNLDYYTVISGWVAIDDDGALFLYRTKPARDEVSGMWMSNECPLDVGINLFPDLTWESDPEPVEIIIKRKKNGNNSTDNRI